MSAEKQQFIQLARRLEKLHGRILLGMFAIYILFIAIPWLRFLVFPILTLMIMIIIFLNVCEVIAKQSDGLLIRNKLVNVVLADTSFMVLNTAYVCYYITLFMSGIWYEIMFLILMEIIAVMVARDFSKKIIKEDYFDR